MLKQKINGWMSRREIREFTEEFKLQIVQLI